MNYFQTGRAAWTALFIVAVVVGLAVTAEARDCAVRPFGLIGERWLELDGADGPLGCPVSEEFGVEGQKDIPGELSGAAPTLAGHAGRLFLAWKGSGNDSLNLMLSGDGGVSFGFKRTFGETSDRSPALVSDGGGLLVAWKERDDAEEHLARHISVARVSLFANTSGAMGIEGLVDKVVLPEMTEQAPALAFHQGRVYIAWVGVGNRRLNLAVSTDRGKSFPTKRILDQTSDAAPALASTEAGLVLAWKEAGSVEIQVSRVTITGNTAGGTGIEGLAAPARIGEQTDQAPALAFHNGRLFLGWKGAGNETLNIAAASPGGFAFTKRLLTDTSDFGPTLASGGRLWMGWRGLDNKRLNVGSAILIGNTAGGFGIERLERISGIKRRFENGEVVWSPAQGPRMLVAGYRQDGNLIVNWGSTAPFEYKKFIVRWVRDGQAGQADVEGFIEPDFGFFRLKAPQPGLYSIAVEGCTEPFIGESNCPQRWTVPVEVDYQPPNYPPCAAAPPPGTAIGDRWIALAADGGALGCPVALERAEELPPQLVRGFAGGEIVALPEMGPQMTLAVYRKGNEIIAEWGTAKENHSLFQLSVDHDGQRIPVDTQPGGTSGRWTLPEAPPGIYRVHLQGCPGDPSSDRPLCSGSASFSGVGTVVVPPPPPPPPTCKGTDGRDIPVIGLIAERWAELGGVQGALGCPLAVEGPVPGEPGVRQMFERGSILWDARRGPRMLVAAWQQHNNIVVRWGTTAPDSFDTFRLHMSFNGRPIATMDCDAEEEDDEDTCYNVKSRPPDCEVDEPCSGGEIRIEHDRSHEEGPEVFTGYGTGRYEFRIEGCEDGDCGGLNRTAPAVVDFRTTGGGPFVGDLPVPRDAKAALDRRVTLTLRAAEFTFNDPRLEISERIFGEGDTPDSDAPDLLAHLYVVDARVAKGWDARDIRRPGRRVPVLAQIDDALRAQTVRSRSGTNFPDHPCKRTGEYDTVMKSYVPMLYRYGRYIAPDARYRLLFLLNKTGLYDEDEEHWNCLTVDIPETENHLWLINSARYLTNQLWAKRSADPRFDNRANGLADRLLIQLQGHLVKDFVEYNSRPYQRYTWTAIQNLHDFAEDPRIRTATQSVLDYVVAKAAVSTSDGRRNPPYRRRASHAQADFFFPQADRLKKPLLAYTAPTPVMDELRAPGMIEDFAPGEMVVVGASDYRPPNLLLDLMLNPDQRTFHQRFLHDSVEIYASEPDYLLVAGGTAAGYAYEASPTFGTIAAGTIAGAAAGLGAVLSATGTGVLAAALTGESSPLSEKDDRGLVQATYLMPTGEFTTVEQLIRFEGRATSLSRNTSACVVPRFACGARPVVPALYTARQGCSIIRGDWTFIDFASDRCRRENERDFGFFAAVNGAGKDFGVLEVLPKRALGGLSLRTFAEGIMRRNQGRSFAGQGEHEYVASDGRKIRISMGDGAIITSTGQDAEDAMLGETERLAIGSIVQSDGSAPAMTIRNAATGEALLLDLADALNPVRILLEPDPLRRLLTRGIVHGVPEAEIRGLLGSIDTPYPALAAAIERDFPEGGLRSPVQIDVVRRFYEEVEGAASPRRVEDVDRQALENALISAHNNLYGEKVTRIEQIRRGPSAPVSMRSVTELAIAFVAQHNRAWSQANAVALRDIEPMYSPRVEFYRSHWSRERVMKEKREFAGRWPERDYYFRPDVGASHCDGSGACSVVGRVEWFARDPARKADSLGTAQVSIGLQVMGDTFIIVNEDGQVISRR